MKINVLRQLLVRKWNSLDRHRAMMLWSPLISVSVEIINMLLLGKIYLQKDSAN